MIGLDSNLIIRMLLDDDRVDSPRARKIFETRCSADHPAVINMIVLAEVCWTLRSRFSKPEIISFLEGLLSTANIFLPDSEIVEAALEDYKTGKADFADYMIARFNKACGASATYTLDKDAAKSPNFKLIPA